MVPSSAAQMLGSPPTPRQGSEEGILTGVRGLGASRGGRGWLRGRRRLARGWNPPAPSPVALPAGADALVPGCPVEDGPGRALGELPAPEGGDRRGATRSEEDTAELP